LQALVHTSAVSTKTSISATKIDVFELFHTLIQVFEHFFLFGTKLISTFFFMVITFEYPPQNFFGWCVIHYIYTLEFHMRLIINDLSSGEQDQFRKCLSLVIEINFWHIYDRMIIQKSPPNISNDLQIDHYLQSWNREGYLPEWPFKPQCINLVDNIRAVISQMMFVWFDRSTLTNSDFINVHDRGAQYIIIAYMSTISKIDYESIDVKCILKFLCVRKNKLQFFLFFLDEC